MLRMDASTVSQLISGKRRGSPKLVEKLCQALSAHPLQKQALLMSSRQKRKKKTLTVESGDNQPDYQQLTLDAFSVVSDWYHFAILDLTTIEGFKHDPAWIARMLDLPVTEVKTAISRLRRLELLEEQDKRLLRTNTLVSNGVSGIDTSAAHKQLQRQVVQKALDAIDSVSQDEKDITSMTMAIDESKLPEARKVIKKFRRDMCQFLESGKRTRVYNLGVQLYPVSKSAQNKE
jgi:uncharacterized protein (TIGR02147 family)